MPSQTLNPSLDGFVANIPGFGVSWATTVAASSGTSHGEASATMWLAEHSNPTFDSKYLYRGFFIFDTSVLPDDATVTAVTLRLTPSAAPFGSGSIRGYGPATPASDTALVNDDLDQHGATVWIDAVLISSFASGVAKDLAFNAAGIAAINLTGKTRFAFRTSWDYTASPAGADTDNGVLVHTNEATDPANRPQLIVTYTSPLVDLSASDSGTGTEGTATVLVTAYPVASDSGTATEGATAVPASVAKSASDSGAATDASSPVAVQVGSWVGDNTAAGPGPWLFGEVNPQTPHDEALATDSGAVTSILGATSLTASDAATATEASSRTVTRSVSASDSAIGTDSSGSSTVPNVRAVVRPFYAPLDTAPVFVELAVAPVFVELELEDRIAED